MKKSERKKNQGKQPEQPKNLMPDGIPRITVQDLMRYPRSQQEYLRNIGQSANDAYNRAWEDARRQSQLTIEAHEKRIKRQALTKVSELVNWFLKDEYAEQQGSVQGTANFLKRA